MSVAASESEDDTGWTRGSVHTSRLLDPEREELNREAHTTLVLVTHDQDLAARAQRVIALSGGRVVSNGERG